MLMQVALGLVAAACLVFAVLNCFIKRNNQYFALLKGLGLMTLICLGLTSASYKNAFDGYSILLVISLLPVFVTLYTFSSTEKAQTENKTEFQDEIGTVQNYDFAKQRKTTKRFTLSKISILLNGAAYLASTACIVFCGLYIGVESVFGYLAGLFLGVAATFLEFLIKKQNVKDNLITFFGKMLFFVSIGLLLTAIIQVLLYAADVTNILFSCALLAYAVYLAMEVEYPNNYSHLAYYAAMFLLFSSIAF